MSGIVRSWWEGLRTGVAVLPTEPVLGLKRIVLPVSYWRSVEFAYIWRQLSSLRNARILDLGSPKNLALSLARSRGLEVVSTDILEAEVSISERSSAAVGRSGRGLGHVHSEIQDGRSLTYPDATFDAAYSVSVLEHIPDKGDTLAIRELVRVVKPGGLIVITTPYDTVHRDTYVEREVYERGFEGHPVFFERHYDAISLKTRLIDASGARLATLELWGEGRIRGEQFLASAGKLRALLSPLEPVLAHLCLRQQSQATPIHPMAAFFTLQKPQLP